MAGAECADAARGVSASDWPRRVNGRFPIKRFSLQFGNARCGEWHFAKSCVAINLGVNL
jgi:hypothetical protein